MDSSVNSEKYSSACASQGEMYLNDGIPISTFFYLFQVYKIVRIYISMQFCLCIVVLHFGDH